MDWEQMLVDLLAPVMAPAGVASRPGSAPPYLRVRRVGGAAHNRVHEDVTMTFEAYHLTETGAIALLERCRAWLLEQAASVARTKFIRSVTEDAGPANLPDPDVPGAQRYTMTVSLGVRRRIMYTTPKE